MLLLAANCNDATFASILLFMKNLVQIICIITPIILILLLTIDFTMAVLARDDNKLAQVKSIALKRIIFAIVLLFVPTIVSTIMGLLGDKSVAFAECYGKVTNAYVDKLTDKLNQDTAEKEKKAEKERQQTQKQIEANKKKRQENAKKAAAKAKNSNNSTNNNNKDGISNTTSTSEKVRNAQSYKSYHQLGTISSCSSSFNVSGGIVQGVAVTDKYYIMSSNSRVVIVYDKSTKKRLKVFERNTGHGNGITYNPNTDTVIITKSYSLWRTKNYVYFSANNLGTRYSLNSNEAKFSNRAAAVAYDRVLNQYYTGGGAYLWIWGGPEKSNTKTTFYKQLTSGRTQDIGAYNGVVYVCRASSQNYIDLYKASSKKYIGTYKVNISGELEGIDYDTSANRFVLAFHGPDKVCELKADAITMK